MASNSEIHTKGHVFYFISLQWKRRIKVVIDIWTPSVFFFKIYTYRETTSIQIIKHKLTLEWYQGQQEDINVEYVITAPPRVEPECISLNYSQIVSIALGGPKTPLYRRSGSARLASWRNSIASWSATYSCRYTKKQLHTRNSVLCVNVPGMIVSLEKERTDSLKMSSEFHTCARHINAHLHRHKWNVFLNLKGLKHVLLITLGKESWDQSPGDT